MTFILPAVRQFIDGHFVDGEGASEDVFNPATGEKNNPCA